MASHDDVANERATTKAAPFRYRAFLSHSRYDRRIAHRLRQKLESYRIPRGLEKYNKRVAVSVKEINKLGRFFMDYDELAASAELGPALNGALDDSQNLIVVASRRAAESKWVNKEIAYFKSRSTRTILALIASGVPNDPKNECFPEALRGADGTIEPGAPNLQTESFSRVFIRIVAGILGIPLQFSQFFLSWYSGTDTIVREALMNLFPKLKMQ